MKHLYIVLFVLTPIFVFSQDNTDTTHKPWNPFSFEGSYVGDAYNNLSGGIKTGAGYLGMGNIRIAFDTKEAHLWKGGVFFINAAATHGKSPSDLVGDFQVVSNIDAGDHMFVQEFWYKQTFGKWDLIIGLQDMNAEFLTSEGGGQFMNSSFGVPSVVSDNVPVPIFPLTTLGIEAKWNISENIVWQSGIFDGNPADFDKNVYNLNWNIKSQDGFLGMSELQFTKTIFNKPTTYKVGAYYHSALKQIDDSTGTYSNIFANNKGLYGIIDQNLWHNSDSSKLFNYFVQFAISPRKDNPHNYYVGAGITFQGLCSKRPNDILGLAFANAGFHNFVHKHETAIELNYKFEITENITFQPCIQYLMNPAGTNLKVKDAIIGFVRIELNF